MSKYSSPDSNINSCLGGWVFWLKSSIKFKSAELFWAENPGVILADSSSIVELLIFGFVEKWDLVMPGCLVTESTCIGFNLTLYVYHSYSTFVYHVKFIFEISPCGSHFWINLIYFIKKNLCGVCRLGLTQWNLNSSEFKFDDTRLSS